MPTELLTIKDIETAKEKLKHAARKTDIQLIQQYLGKRLEPLTNPIGAFLMGKEQQVS